MGYKKDNQEFEIRAIEEFDEDAEVTYGMYLDGVLKGVYSYGVVNGIYTYKDYLVQATTYDLNSIRCCISSIASLPYSLAVLNSGDDIFTLNVPSRSQVVLSKVETLQTSGEFDYFVSSWTYGTQPFNFTSLIDVMIRVISNDLGYNIMRAEECDECI